MAVLVILYETAARVQGIIDDSCHQDICFIDDANDNK